MQQSPLVGGGYALASIERLCIVIWCCQHRLRRFMGVRAGSASRITHYLGRSGDRSLPRATPFKECTYTLRVPNLTPRVIEPQAGSQLSVFFHVLQEKIWTKITLML